MLDVPSMEGLGHILYAAPVLREEAIGSHTDEPKREGRECRGGHGVDPNYQCSARGECLTPHDDENAQCAREYRAGEDRQERSLAKTAQEQDARRRDQRRCVRCNDAERKQDQLTWHVAQQSKACGKFAQHDAGERGNEKGCQEAQHVP